MSICGSAAEEVSVSCVPFIRCGPLTTHPEIVSTTVIFLNFIDEEMRLRIQSEPVANLGFEPWFLTKSLMFFSL